MKSIEKKDKVLVFITGALLGFIVFVLMYGTKILDVTYDDWLINDGGDLSQHYEGWLFYRKSSWKFPIGLIDGLLEDTSVSVTFMDSIPILAVFFKVFEGILPSTFQYFGVYGLVCYMLQGGLSGLLAYRLTKNKYVGLIAPVFFVTNPVFVTRMFMHSALACHPIILMSILLAVDTKKLTEKKRDVIYWAVLMFVSSWVHLYYVPMVTIMMLGAYLKELLSKKWYIVVGKMIIVCSFTLDMMYIIGDFYGKSSLGTMGFGDYNYDWIAFIDSCGTSLFSEMLKLPKDRVGEQYAYLGAGVIFAVLFSLTYLIMTKKIRKLMHDYVHFVVVAVVLLMLAAIPSIRIATITYGKLELPSLFEEIMNMFRVNCRFAWPVMYLLCFFSIYVIGNELNKKAPIILIGVCLLQIIDMSPILVSGSVNCKDAFYNRGFLLENSAWNDIEAEEMYFMKEPISYVEDNRLEVVFALGKIAYDKDMTMNDFYVSRKSYYLIEQYRKREYEKLKLGDYAKGRLYIFDIIPKDLVMLNGDMHYYNLDSVIIGTTQILKNMNDLKSIQLVENNQIYIPNGTFDHGVWSIPIASIQRGPYYTLDSGRYSVEYMGEGLEKAFFEVTGENGDLKIDIQDIVIGTKRVMYNMDIKEKVNGVEIKCVNNGDREILIDEIILKKIE